MYFKSEVIAETPEQVDTARSLGPESEVVTDNNGTHVERFDENIPNKCIWRQTGKLKVEFLSKNDLRTVVLQECKAVIKRI